ncbi:MAG: transglycosylase domain-containing protein [Candidatus Thiodiazotropha sp.]
MVIQHSLEWKVLLCHTRAIFLCRANERGFSSAETKVKVYSNIINSMQKLIKYNGLFLLIVILAIAIYYLYSIHEARQYTREIVLPDLAKDQWRYPSGAIQKLNIYHYDLSERQKEMLIKVQDPGFYDHYGIDLSTPGAGLTTITQAIVKKLYFDDFKPGIAKIKQSLIAYFVVNELITKDEQLTLFINLMYLGNVDGDSVVGLVPAANAYYQLPVSKLSVDQYVSLVAMLIAPATFHIKEHPDWNLERVNRIKALVAGDYKPKGLMDQFYSVLPQEIINTGLPAASYFSNASD